MYIPGQNYRSTTLYRLLTSTQKIKPTTSKEENKYLPNFRPSGSTYDASHMDKFLSTSQYGRVAPSVSDTRASVRLSRRDRSPNENSFQSKVREKVEAALQLKRSSTVTYLREPDYLNGTIKDFSFKQAKNNTALILAGTEMTPEKIRTHYEKEFGLLEKTFDKSKLEYSDQPSGCDSVEKRRQQLVEVKKNQVEQANWREKKNEVKRKIRVYKNTYSHGALGVDNPMNESTMLYKEEYEKAKKAQEETMKIERRRLEQLKDIMKSSSMIEFFNKNFDKSTTLPVPKILEKNRRKQVKTEFAEKWSNSSERLFNQPVAKRYSVERARHLRNQETKGRDWDILSFTNNAVDIKTLPALEN